MKPYFKMRKYQDKDDLQQIQLIYSAKGEVVKLDTGVKTKPEYWSGLIEGFKNRKNREGRISSRCKEIGDNHNILNLRLDNAMRKLDDIVNPFRNKTITFSPTIDYVKDKYYSEEKKLDNDQDAKKQLYLWIPEKADEHGVKLYHTLLHDLIDMTLPNPLEKWKKIPNEEIERFIQKSKPLLFSQIDKKFLQSYIKYLKSRTRKRFQKTDTIQYSTINKRIQALKAFLRAMNEKGINEFDNYQEFKTKLKEIHKQPVIIPTQKEFLKLLNADLTNYPTYNYARDIFIFGCLTGLRFGDIIKISKKNVVKKSGERYIITDISKTKEKRIIIPLTNTAYNILEKNNFQFKITNQELNRNLHDMLKYLGFIRKDIRYEKRAKDSVDIELPIYKLITMHSSRRFFISSLVNSKKVNLGNVMKWTRHRTDVIMRYIEEGHEEEEQMRQVFEAFEKESDKK
jgi:integrase